MTNSIVKGNEDFVRGPYTAEFRARMSRAEISIRINDDNIFEGNEYFILSIDSSSLPYNITVVRRDQAAVAIIDDDCELA